MQVPLDIQSIVTDGLSHMDSHPGHHFDWRIRRDMYHRMKNQYGQRGSESHGWLAVITAEQVLPLFTATFPDDLLPQQLVHCALQIMQKTVDPNSKDALELEDHGYLSTGIDCMTWRPVIAYHAEYAGDAAYKALMEARGEYQLLDHTEQLIRGQAAQVFHMPANTSPDEVTDSDIAHLAAFCDTAGSAAIAFACHKERFLLDRQRLKLFWEWWATTAIPETWARV